MLVDVELKVVRMSEQSSQDIPKSPVNIPLQEEHPSESENDENDIVADQDNIDTNISETNDDEKRHQPQETPFQPV